MGREEGEGDGKKREEEGKGGKGRGRGLPFVNPRYAPVHVACIMHVVVTQGCSIIRM